MKKIIVLLLILIIVSGCSNKKNDTLVIGFTDYPPMGFKDETGEIVGFDIDFAKAVSELMGVEPTFQYINWDAKVLELNSKQIDLIWNGFTVTEERKKEVLFSNPYIVNSIVILTNDSDNSIETLNDLKSKTVAVESESSGQHALESTFSSTLNLNRFTSISEAILDMKAGNSDAVVADEIYARYLVSKDSEVKVVENINMNAEDYAVGLRLEDKELQIRLNDAIKQVIENGTAREISIKWFGEDILK